MYLVGWIPLPRVGYEFSHWELDHQFYSANDTLQINLEKNILVKAYFNVDENNLVNPINKTTFDYRKLIVEIKRGTFRWQKEIYLPLAFTEHEVKFDIHRSSTDYEVNIISTDDDIELIKCDILV